MQDDLTRAARYCSLATAMRQIAEHADEKRCADVLSLANEYELLAERLIGRRAAAIRD